MSAAVDYPYVNRGYSEVNEFLATDKDAWSDMMKCMDGLRMSETEKVGLG